jgi:hypothetical protein
LDALVLCVERLGFSVLDATVNEWASQILERGLVGLLGGGALGAASDNGAVAFVAAVGGALLGGLSGVEARRLKAEYEARRDAWGWLVVPSAAVARRGHPAGNLSGLTARVFVWAGLAERHHRPTLDAERKVAVLASCAFVVERLVSEVALG